MLASTTLITKERAPQASPVYVKPLANDEQSEVLRFLSQRALHTVTLMSLIQDNGLVHPFNRGTFYGCRDTNGQLEGVALVGHATLLETVSDRALALLAAVAQQCPNMHLIMGEKERVDDFWSHYANAGRRQRLACREWLFELNRPSAPLGPVSELRPATAHELDLVMPIQAELAFAESGVNPMQVDPKGFRSRCLRRIEQERTWVVVEDDRLIFKADVISKTPAVVYVEGIWVRDERRHDGNGVRFMNELTHKLLADTNSICLLVNESNERAQSFYRKCGFRFRATYETIFLPRKEFPRN
jgi:ribosomal protein S18 acetylase RimI-like enzyme